MKKAMITAIVLLLFSVSGCGNNTELEVLKKENKELKQQISNMQKLPIPTATPSVKAELNLDGVQLVKEEIDNLKRADLWAILPSSDTLSEDEIKQYMRSIILNYIDENKVTAVSLCLADNEEDVRDQSYTLGMCTYYPNGNIANASTTTPGDYSSFVFKYTVNSRENKKSQAT